MFTLADNYAIPPFVMMTEGYGMLHLEGQEFGRLTVIRRGADAKWMCRCECGRITYVVTTNLRRGNTRSCGCAQKESATKHGQAYSPEYSVWRGMHSRCRDAGSAAFRNYGARGITVCPEWKDFSAFLRDMGQRPSPGHELDRIDNSRGYSRDNCRWVSCQKNLNNKRNNRTIEYAGKSQTIAEWARELGLHYRTLNNRINRGWPLDKALAKGSN